MGSSSSTPTLQTWELVAYSNRCRVVGVGWWASRKLSLTHPRLNKQQQGYCVTCRELLAILVCLREFRNHLLGCKFTIHTDHGSLAWLLNFKEPQGQLARWLEYIFQFRFHIVHRDGKKHTNADALSRNPAHGEGCDGYQPGVAHRDLPCGGCSYCEKHHEEWAGFHQEVDDVVPLGQSCRQVSTRSQTKSSWLGSQWTDGGATKGPCSNAVVKKPKTHANQVDLQGLKKTVSEWMRDFFSVELSVVQKNDTVLGELHHWIELGRKPEPTEAMSLSPALCCYWLNYKLLRCIDGVLYLEWQDPCPGFSPVQKVWVPVSLKEEVLQLCNDSLFAGHMGVRRTLNRVRRVPLVRNPMGCEIAYLHLPDVLWQKCRIANITPPWPISASGHHWTVWVSTSWGRCHWWNKEISTCSSSATTSPAGSRRFRFLTRRPRLLRRS